MSSKQETDYQIVMQYMASLTKLDGRRPKTSNKNKDNDNIENHKEMVSWIPKGLIDVPRFELPMDIRRLQQLDPLTYLTKYCIVTSRVKKLLYHRHYSKYREARSDGIDTIDKIKKAVRDVCTFSVNNQTHSPSDGSMNYYLHGILGLELDQPVRVGFKNFLGIAALAERIFNPNYMDSWMANEKQMEMDFQTYKELREKEVELKDKIEKREAEEAQHQQKAQKSLEISESVRNRLQLSDRSSELESRLKTSDTYIATDAVSPSEEQLNKQVKEKRLLLEQKISITQILELESRPNRSPRELMEQIDFHAIKWRLDGIQLSPLMERLIKIVVSL